MWTIHSGTATSSGDRSSDLKAGKVMAMPSAGTTVAITVEPAGGSSEPTSNPDRHGRPRRRSDAVSGPGGGAPARPGRVVAAEAADRAAAPRARAAQQHVGQVRCATPHRWAGVSRRARFGAHGQSRSPWKMWPPGIARSASTSCGIFASRHGLPSASRGEAVESSGSSRCCVERGERPLAPPRRAGAAGRRRTARPGVCRPK